MRAAGRWSGRVVLALATVLGVIAAAMAVSVWIGSEIPRGGAWHEPRDGVTILVGTNGVHTEIVMPLETPIANWRAVFPASDLADPYRPYTHVAVSWGEREFFLNTPTWADLDPVHAVGALTGGEGLLHVAHYVRPAPSDDYRPVRLRAHEYRRLAEAIAAFAPREPTTRSYPGYEGYDVFYSSPGTYHAFNTCNQWTGNMLAAAGLRMGRWTPMAGSVMKWVPPFELGEAALAAGPAQPNGR